MTKEIMNILTDSPDTTARLEGGLWQIRCGRHSGARVDGVSLAHDLMKLWREDPSPAPPQPAKPAPAATPVGVRTVLIRGKAYPLTDGDALTLVGALARGMDSEISTLTLASGEILKDLTHQEVSSLCGQLAGKPADEVSG